MKTEKESKNIWKIFLNPPATQFEVPPPSEKTLSGFQQAGKKRGWGEVMPEADPCLRWLGHNQEKPKKSFKIKQKSPISW